MAIWARNVLPPAVGASWGPHMTTWFLREMLFVARWTENSNNGHAAWSSALNILASVAAGPNGLAVTAANPRLVYSPSGIFTSNMVNAVLALHATNDQNRSMWRIIRYIDANYVEVDAASFSPFGWVDESGMAARISVGNGAMLANGSWSLMDGPVGTNLQVYIYYESNNSVYAGVRPKGKLGSVTTVGGAISLNEYYNYSMRLNLYADGYNFLGFWPCSNGLVIYLIGHLTNTDPADTDPGFVLVTANGASYYSWNIPMYMLDGAGGPAQIRAYPMTIKRYFGLDDSASLETKFGRRLVNGRPGFASLRSPWVVLENTAAVGACPRGKLPIVKFTYTGFEAKTPLDAAGDWMHLASGLVVPRNGPSDPVVISV